MSKPVPILYGTVKRDDFKPVERTLKVQENYLRRQAQRLGLTLTKSRAKKWSIDNHGGYMLITFDNSIFAGEKFDLSLGQVEVLLKKRENELRTNATGWTIFREYSRR